MPKPAIQFFYQIHSFSFRKRRKLKDFLCDILRREQTQAAELRIIFCDDSQVLKINQQYLNHDFYTDVITFNLANAGELLNAELYISVDRVRANALAIGVSFSSELHRVIFHGVLHLCGYKDKSSQQIKRIRKREDLYLRLYFKQ